MSEHEINYGFSTGICAAGAVKACAVFLRYGYVPECVSVKNLEGQIFNLNVTRRGNMIGIIKDSGDDQKHDITHGIFISAEIKLTGRKGGVKFLAGAGVGTVTLKGLKIPVGEPAINPIPRIIIKNTVREIFFNDEEIIITIKIPDGEKIARDTFNSRLGIIGGLSILGTTGIVKPMNEAALLESLSLEMNVIKNLGHEKIFIAFGHSSAEFLLNEFNLHESDRNIIQAENYIGHVIDEAVKLNFTHAVIAGQPGKLLKVAAGNFQTHNKISDGRFEALCCHLGIIGAPSEFIKKIYSCNTTDEAVKIIRDNKFERVWKNLAQAVVNKCNIRVKYKIKFSVYFIDLDGGLLSCEI